MKKFFAFLVASLLVASSAFAQEVSDSREIARAALLRPATHYTFNVYMQIEGKEKAVQMDGRLSLDLRIDELRVDNEQIPIDEPLEALPWPITGKVTYFSMWLVGRNGGQMVSYGSFSENWGMEKGAPVHILLHPAEVQVVIEYTPPSGTNTSQLVLNTHSGGNATWDSSLGGFLIYVDPTSLTSYTILDRVTDIVYERGTIDPYSDEGVNVSDGSVVNVGWTGGVRNLDFGVDGYVGFDEQQLDSHVPWQGEIIPAKVYMTSGVARQPLYLYVTDIEGTLTVQEVTSSGPMPRILMAKSLMSEEGQHYLQVEIPAGYEQVIITITGKVKTSPYNTTGKGFRFTASKGGSKG